MAGVNPPVRVLVVDDDALVRAGLTMMLDGAPGEHELFCDIRIGQAAGDKS